MNTGRCPKDVSPDAPGPEGLPAHPNAPRYPQDYRCLFGARPEYAPRPGEPLPMIHPAAFYLLYTVLAFLAAATISAAIKAISRLSNRRKSK